MNPKLRVGSTLLLKWQEFSADVEDNVELVFKFGESGDVIMLDLLDNTYANAVDANADELNRHEQQITIGAPLTGENVYIGIREATTEYVEWWGPYDVISGVATSVQISPSTARVSPVKTRQFTATYYAADGLPTEEHGVSTWAVVSGGGDIDSGSGLFTAPASPEDGIVIGVIGGALNDTATINVSLSSKKTRRSIISIACSI
jgi:hypothetical protein